ncbi:MAG: hypothetical protein ACREQC_15340 [Candidatus Binataceae bacterium]
MLEIEHRQVDLEQAVGEIFDPYAGEPRSRAQLVDHRSLSEVPKPPCARVPALEDVANQKQLRRFMASKEIVQGQSAGSMRAKMQVRDPDGAIGLDARAP